MKSQFITSVFPVETLDDARRLLGEIHNEMPDASHHVYAFIVGHGNAVMEGLSDAGEPAGTAGLPVMTVLRGSGLGDTLVVVTRYFGGTLLGTGGLVRAYTDSAKAGLAGVRLEAKVELQQFLAILPYNCFERAIRLFNDFDVVVVEQEFAGDVTLLLAIPVEHTAELRVRIADLCAGKAEFAAI